MRINQRYLLTGFATLSTTCLFLAVPLLAGEMKPYVGRSEQVYAEFVGSLEGLNDPRLSEIVSSYDDTGVLLTFYAIRYQEAINNVGGKCTAIAKEVGYVYAEKPAEWFITRVITTANGDEIHQELSGIAYPIAGPDSDLFILGNWEIVGGSGRFEGAIGFGELQAFADPTGAVYLTAILKGKISTVGSRRRAK